MACLLLVIGMAVFAAAELPPSNSYLPPSPVSGSAGYPQGSQSGAAFPGAPQIIAARNLEQGGQARGNSYSRSSLEPDQGRLGVANQGYHDADVGRNAIDTNSEPANYNFGYMVSDYNEGTDFGHREERLEERAQGEYHVVLPDGRKQTVSYEADARGFKPQVSYQDSEDLAHTNGYDVNANDRSRSNGYDASPNTRSLDNGYDANASTRSLGNGYDANANTRSLSNGYDANDNNRSHANGYDTNVNIHSRGNGYNANTRSRGNGYDGNARSHGNDFNNAGHSEEARNY